MYIANTTEDLFPYTEEQHRVVFQMTYLCLLLQNIRVEGKTTKANKNKSYQECSALKPIWKE